LATVLAYYLLFSPFLLWVRLRFARPSCLKPAWTAATTRTRGSPPSRGYNRYPDLTMTDRWTRKHLKQRKWCLKRSDGLSMTSHKNIYYILFYHPSDVTFWGCTALKLFYMSLYMMFGNANYRKKNFTDIQETIGIP